MKIKQANTEEESLEIAKIRTKRLVDVLAVFSGKHLGYFLTGSQTTQKKNEADRKGMVSKTFIVNMIRIRKTPTTEQRQYCPSYKLT